MRPWQRKHKLAPVPQAIRDAVRNLAREGFTSGVIAARVGMASRYVTLCAPHPRRAQGNGPPAHPPQGEPQPLYDPAHDGVPELSITPNADG
jgi:hypothetical protein